MDDYFSYPLIFFSKRYLMLKGLLCGILTSDHPHWHHRIHCLSFVFEHDKGTSEICPSLDFSIIIVSYLLCINCMNYVLYPCCGFSYRYAVQSDLDCIVSHVTLINCFLILPGLVFLYHLHAHKDFCKCNT